MYIYKYIYIIKQLRISSCTHFWSTCIYFPCITMALEQVETWEKFLQNFQY